MGASRPAYRHGSMRSLLACGTALLVAIATSACGRDAPELRGTVLVAHAVSRDVVVLQAPSLEPIGRIALPASPGHIIAEPSMRRAWTTLPLADSVAILDIDARRILRTIRVCRGPTQIAFWAPLHRAFVVCNDGYMITMDTRTLERVGRRQAIGFGPYAFGPGPNAHLWAANRSSNDISEIDPRTGRLLGHYPAGPAAYGLAFTPDHRYAFVTSKEWNATAVLAADDKEILGSIPTGKDPALVVASEDRIFVASRGAGIVSVVNARTFQVVQKIRVGKHPETVVLAADDRVLLVTTQAELIVVDATTGAILTRRRTGQGPVSVTVAA